MIPIPVGCKILAKAYNREKTSGGIVLPEQTKTNLARIIALGSGRRNGEKIDFDVKVGDLVRYNQASKVSDLEGNEYIVFLNEDNITVVLEREE